MKCKVYKACCGTRSAFTHHHMAQAQSITHCFTTESSGNSRELLPNYCTPQQRQDTGTHILHLSGPSQAVQVLCKPNRAHPEARETRIAATTLAASCCVCTQHNIIRHVERHEPRDGGPTVRFNGQTRRSSLHISREKERPSCDRPLQRQKLLPLSAAATVLYVCAASSDMLLCHSV